MKNYLRNFILKYRFSNVLYRILVSKTTKLSILESKKRMTIDIFDYVSLAKPIKKNYQFLPSENNLYGSGKLLNLIGMNPDKYVLEHGFIFGSFVSEFKIKSWAKNLVTFSDYRKNFLLSKTNKKVICVGPYIHYFHSLVQEDKLQNLKKELGSVLLVFPSHSLSDIDVEYNKKEFKDKIIDLSNSYDTVLICLYWADILKGDVLNDYQNKKFKIVTAGHIYDTYFLNRLRSIFDLCDHVFSNSVGTHVGYAIYLNKPIYLINQNIKYKSNNSKSKGLTQRNDEDHLSKDSIINEVYSLFNKNTKQITSKQYSFISKLFGFEHIKK